jgi:hypothetical protein
MVKKKEAGHPPKAAHPNDTRTSVNYMNVEIWILLHLPGRFFNDSQLLEDAEIL